MAAVASPRTQTEPAFGAAAMKSVSTQPVVMAKDAPMSVSVGEPLASLLTSRQPVWVPRWKPIPTQLTTALSVRVVASAAVERRGRTMPCRSPATWQARCG